MEQISEWAAAAIFLLTPLYFMLRFRLPGLFLSVLGLWLAFGVLSEFFPLSRPGWEPLRNPLAFIFGLVCYLIPFLVIYGLKHIALWSLSSLATILHRRSLTCSFVALLFGLIALARVFNFAGLAHMHGRQFVQQSIIVCIASFAVCGAVLANLVLDVRRGYSPGRCSLASVIMLAAFAGPVLLAITLASYFSR